MADVDHFVSGLTVTASLLSLVGTAFILICYLILPHRQHVRHALIVNLTIADFINAVNNSVSGLWVLANNQNLSDGSACVANGFVGQLSVQAVDFSVLAITIVTLWIVKSQRVIADIRLRYIAMICASAWIMPIITSFIALFKGWYHPASPNWCWIQDSPTYLRYVLTHGWRFVIIFIVTGICIYIQIYLRRNLRFKASLARSPYIEIDHPGVSSLEKLASKRSKSSHRSTDNEDEEQEIGSFTNSSAQNFVQSSAAHGGQTSLTLTPQSSAVLALPSKLSIKFSGSHIKTATANQWSSIEKTMLLNAYPIFYIILWIPGIANRIAQATGHDIYILQTLQASTQLIGFANAVTFGWNERIGKHLGARIRGAWRGVGVGGEERRWTIE